MNLAITLRTALSAIVTNKMRSFLTMLGVIIGVASVVLLIAIGNGLTAYITDQFNSLGANTIFVMPGDVLSGGLGNHDQQIAAFANNKLKAGDVVDIRGLGYPVIKVAPMVQQSAKLAFGSKEETYPVLGSEPEYQAILNTSVEIGSFFTKADNQVKRRVAVIGPEIQEELFGKVDPVGKQVKLNGQGFTVIGVTKAKGGGIGGESLDNNVVIPIQTYFNLFDTDKIMQISVQVAANDQIETAKQEITRLLGKRLKADEFSLVETTQILDIISQVLGTLTLGLGGIAAISLVVGGIGIMNIMLVSVTERTREIGLRKALGATPNNILLQFLIESSVLSVIGGMIGTFLAFLGSLAINQFFPAKITLEAVLLAFGVSTAIGVIFGVAPARRASKLSPIEALRYE